jgi:DNA-binding winged helix-turn-helix (wHTH) protein
MDMGRSVALPGRPCHQAAVNERRSFAEEFLKGGTISDLRTAVTSEVPVARVVAFGPFSFDRTNRLLSKDGLELPLPPRVLGVLALLLERPGELVTKQELIATVWRDAFVTETSLAEAISVLRQTLGDDSQRPTYIQTLHRRGYRFIAQAPRSAPVAVETEPRLSRLVPWIITLFALLTAGSAVWRFANRVTPPPRATVRFTVPLLPGLTVAGTGAPVAVSGDGSLLAVAACSGSECLIYLRPLSRAELTPVAGTSEAAAPFFSPDGGSLGYFANGRLYTIALGGGSPATIADAPEPLGAVWLRDGRIVYARRSSEGLFTVDGRGGRAQPLTTPGNGERGHRWPATMPDESAVLFTVDAAQDYAGAVSLRTRSWSRLLDDVTAVRAPVSGYLLAERGTDLVASTVNERSLSTSGLPVPVAALERASANPQFAMSAAGTLVIGSPGSDALHVALDWVDELRRLVPSPQPSLPR